MLYMAQVRCEASKAKEQEAVQSLEERAGKGCAQGRTARLIDGWDILVREVSAVYIYILSC